MRKVSKVILISILFISSSVYAKTVVTDRAEIIAGLKKGGSFYFSTLDPSIRKDKEIVLIAVKEDGGVLEYADNSMKDDKEVVLVAIRNDSGALKYASPRLKKDKEVVLAAAITDRYALKDADKSLRENRQFLSKLEAKRAKKLKELNPPIRKTAPNPDAKAKRTCWRYDVNAFVSKSAKKMQALYVWKKQKSEKDWKRKSPKLMAVVVKTKQKIYRHNFIECHAKGEKYRCGGECDTGQLKLDDKMHMKLDFLYFTHDDSEGIVTDLELSQKNSSEWHSPKKVQCPEYVIEGRYVCYDKKVITYKVGYEGCIRSKVSCGSIGKRHFGHYGSDSAAESAYFRCEQNRPNQKQEKK